jgi:uncharacterized protein (DUF433 family)
VGCSFYHDPQPAPGSIGYNRKWSSLPLWSRIMTHAADVLPIQAEFPPLSMEESGAMRVGKSRVSLDLVVEQYENGMTAEDLVRAYDTLQLADVHAVIAYYLRHRESVGTYLQRRRAEAEALRGKIESGQPPLRRQDLCC